MVNKSSKTKAVTTPAGKRVEASFPKPADEGMASALAKLAVRPSVNAAVVMETYSKSLGKQDVGSLVDALGDKVKAMWEGDMTHAEAMLFGQAHALQAMFVTLARQAASQDYLKQWDGYMRMALKAQNQCRMTLETLATIKNPPVVFARQANINHGGQQQVNNGTQPAPMTDAAPEGGGIESLEAPKLGTACGPTQTIFPPFEVNSNQPAESRVCEAK